MRLLPEQEALCDAAADKCPHLRRCERGMRRRHVRADRRQSYSRGLRKGNPSTGCRSHRRRRKDADAGTHRSSHPCLHRSEEHTSELQSLMRISYAVFCLKKKKKSKYKNTVDVLITL